MRGYPVLLGAAGFVSYALMLSLFALLIGHDLTVHDSGHVVFFGCAWILYAVVGVVAVVKTLKEPRP